MSLATLLDTPCEIVRREESGDYDAHGNPIAVETITEVMCALQQRQRTEPEGAGELSDTLWALFLPTGTAIDTSDAVVVEGRVYELVGEPWDAQAGSADVHHVEATVRRTAGGEAGS